MSQPVPRSKDEQKESTAKRQSVSEEKGDDDQPGTARQGNCNKCTVCNKTVGQKDIALQCEMCETWLHIKCQDVSKQMYELLKTEGAAVHWYCKVCNKNFAKLVSLMSSIKQRQDALEARVDVMVSDIESVNSSLGEVQAKMEEIRDGKLTEGLRKAIESVVSGVKGELATLCGEVTTLKGQLSQTDTKLDTAIEAKLVESLTKNADTIKEKFEPSWTSVVAKAVDSKLGQVSGEVNKVQETLAEVKVKADEEQDKESRAHNVIIYRVPENGTRDERVKTDKTFCMNLLKNALRLDAQENDIKAVFRLGKRDTGDRPMMLQFRDKMTKNSMMESLYKLRDADDCFKNISVTHDLTQMERAECKKLVEEAKKKQQEEQGEYIWRVRGLPGQLKLLKIRKSN